MVITVVLLLHSLLMRSLRNCRRPVSARVRSIIRAVSSRTLDDRFGAAGYFVEQTCGTGALAAAQSKAVSVGAQIRRDRETNAYADWPQLAATLDRIALAVLVIVYAVLALVWSPAMA